MKLAIITATVALLATGAHAATLTATSASQAASGSLSASGASVQQAFTAPSQMTYGGAYTIHNTPDVQAPVFTGGTNACTVSAGVGGAVAGFGIAGGMSWSDHNCEKRAESAMLYLEGQHTAAVALLCQFADVKKAMASAATPCPGTALTKAAGFPVAPRVPVCRQVFVPPATPNGAGYMRRECH